MLSGLTDIGAQQAEQDQQAIRQPAEPPLGTPAEPQVPDLKGVLYGALMQGGTLPPEGGGERTLEQVITPTAPPSASGPGPGSGLQGQRRPPAPPPLDIPLPSIDMLDKDPIVYLGEAPGSRRDAKMSKLPAKAMTMALKDFNKNGMRVQITGPKSTYRSRTDQESLRQQLGDIAAPPGSSHHEYGFAVDISGTDVDLDEFEKVAEKYGFARSVPGEPWHFTWQPGVPAGSGERVWKDGDPRMRQWMQAIDYRGAGDKREQIHSIAAGQGLSPKGQAIFSRLLIAESGQEGITADGNLKVSWAGATGIGQMMPETLAPYLRKRFPSLSAQDRLKKYKEDEALQTEIAAEHFGGLLRRYKGNAAKALAAYNGGPGAVDYAETHGGWPVSQSRDSWYRQTLPYISEILEVDPDTAMRWVTGKNEFPTVESPRTPHVEVGAPMEMQEDPEKGLQAAKISEAYQEALDSGELDPPANPFEWWTDEESEGVRAKIESGQAATPAEVHFRDMAEGAKSTLFGAGASLAFFADLAGEVGQQGIGLAKNVLTGQGPVTQILTKGEYDSNFMSDQFGFGFQRKLVEMLPKSGWHSDVQAQLNQDRGGKDFLGWAVAAARGESTAKNALGANLGSFGMEIPFLAGSYIATLGLGPETGLLKPASTTSKGGLLASMGPKGEAVRAGAFGVLAKSWNIPNKVVQKLGFKGLDLSNPAVQTGASYLGLGTLIGFAEGHSYAKRDGLSNEEALASGFLGAALGYALGGALKPLTSGAAKGSAMAKTRKRFVEKGQLLGGPVHKYMTKSMGDFARALDDSMGGLLSRALESEILPFARRMQRQLSVSMGVRESSRGLNELAGHYKFAARKAYSEMEHAEATRAAAEKAEHDAKKKLQSFGPLSVTGQGGNASQRRAAQLAGAGFPVQGKKNTRRAALEMGATLREGWYAGKAALDDLTEIAATHTGDGGAPPTPEQMAAGQAALKSWMEQNASILEDAKIDPSSIGNVVELQREVTKHVGKLKDNYQKVMETYDVDALQVEEFTKAKEDYAQAKADHARANNHPMIVDREGYERTAEFYDQTAGVLEETARYSEEAAMAFVERGPIILNPETPHELTVWPAMQQAKETWESYISRLQATKKEKQTMQEAFADASLEQWQKHLNEYVNGRPHWSTSEDALAAQTTQMTRAALAGESIDPHAQIKTHRQYYTNQLQSNRHQQRKLKDHIADVEKRASRPDIDELQGERDRLNLSKTDAEKQLKELQKREAELEAGRERLTPTPVVARGQWGEYGPQLAPSVHGEQIFQSLKAETAPYDLLRELDPAAVGLSSIPGFQWMAARDVGISGAALEATTQVLIETHPLLGAIRVNHLMSPGQRAHMLAADVAQFSEGFLDQLVPSRQALRDMGENPDTGIPQHGDILTDPNAAYRYMNPEVGPTSEDGGGWMPKDVFVHADQSKIMSGTTDQLVTRDMEMVQTGQRLLGQIEAQLRNYSELKFPVSIHSAIRRAQNVFQTLTHMTQAARQTGQLGKQAFRHAIQTLPPELRGTRSRSGQLKDDVALELAEAIDAYPKDGGQMMRALLDKTPDLKPLAKLYFGHLRAMEQIKVVHPHLDAHFRTSAFFHMYPDLNEHVLRTQMIRDWAGVGATLSSERARKIPDITTARELTSKAYDQIGQVLGKSDPFLRVVKKPPSSPRGRKDLWLSLGKNDKARVMGFNPEKLSPEQKSAVDEVTLGLLVENIETDPATVMGNQVAAVFTADAQRTAMGHLMNLHIPDTMRNGEPIRALMHVPDGDVPAVPSLLDRAAQAYQGDVPRVPMAKLSNALRMNDGDMIRLNGKEYPAGELYMHPDILEDFTGNFQSKTQTGDQQVSEAINSLSRMTQLMGSPLYHFWNLSSSQWHKHNAEAIGAIWDSTKQMIMGAGATGGRAGEINARARSTGAAHLAKAIREFFGGVTGADSLGAVATGNRALAGTTPGVEPAVLLNDMVAHGVNLRLWNPAMRKVQEEVVRLANMELETPLTLAQDQVTRATQVSGSFQDGVSESLERFQSADGAGAKFAEGASGLAHTVYNADYHMNSWATFEPARQALIGGFYRLVGQHWRIHGQRMIDSGMPVGVALKTVKEEVARQMNIQAGAIQGYHKLKLAGQDLTQLAYQGPIENPTGKGGKVINVLFSGLTPGWWRAKFEPLLATRSGRRFLDPRTWAYSGDEVKGELARSRTRYASNPDPEYAAHTQRRAKTGLVVAAAGSLAFLKMTEWIAQGTGDFAAMLTGQQPESGQELVSNDNWLSEMRTGPASVTSNPSLGVYKMILGWGEDMWNPGAGWQGVKPFNILKSMTYDQVGGLGKTAFDVVASAVPQEYRGIQEISNPATAWEFGRSLVHHAAKDTVGQPITEVLGYDNRFEMFADRKSPVEWGTGVAGLRVRHYDPRSKAVRQIRELYDQEMVPHRRKIALYQERYRKALRHGTQAEQDIAFEELINYLGSRWPVMSAKAKKEPFASMFIDGKVMLGKEGIRQNLEEVLVDGMDFRSLPKVHQAAYFNLLEEREYEVLKANEVTP